MSWRWFRPPRAAMYAAFEELVRRYDRNVFRIAQHITQNREDAEDVVQDAFLKAYTQSGAVPGPVEVLYLAGAHCGQRSADEVAAPSARAHGFAGRRCKDGRGFGSARSRGLESESGAAVQPGGVEGNPDARRFRDLPPSFRTVFVLRDVEGLSTEETAEALGAQHPGGEVAVAAGPVAIAGTAQPLLPET